MPFLLVTVVISLAVSAYAFVDPVWQDALLVSVPVALAALFLLLRNRSSVGPMRRVVLDGSNVMYWGEGIPRLDPVLEVVEVLKAGGYQPGVMFDANAGHLLAKRYMDDAEFAKILGLRRDAVVVVPNGTPADPVILQAARDLNAAIVTNDRFRDWQADFADVLATPGRLMKGGYRNGELWLEFEAEPEVAQKRARGNSGRNSACQPGARGLNRKPS